MQIIYNIVAILLVIIALPIFAIRTMREGGFWERLKQSFGFLPPHILDPVAKKNCIWVHAASVGEIVAASPLIKEFRKEFPKKPILVSVVTNNGYEMAKRIVKDADSIIYFPIDLPWLSSGVVKKVMPSVFLPVETELWPNFLKAARKYRIPVMMVNGRISDKSVRRYHHLRGVLKDMIGTVSKFCMQSEIDAQYIVQLGAPPEFVTVTGNTKFDQTYTDINENEKKILRSEMGLGNCEMILLAGSTHKGEEDVIFKAFGKIRERFPKVRLIIAPRNIMRADEIVDLAQHYHFKAAKRTVLKETLTNTHDVVILDTIGELGKIYGVGDIVYVGGSLVSHGGHNILEPAAHGKPIIVGPNMFNFKDTYALFSARKACLTVKNAEQLTNAVLGLLDKPEDKAAMEAETLAIVRENQGASRKSALLLREVLEEYKRKSMVTNINKSDDFIENIQSYLYKMVHGEAKGVLANIFMMVLYFFSFIYCQLLELKLTFYRWGLLKQYRLDCHVISLGNITVGGTGKTPTAQRLAVAIRDMGYKVVILNRGYRAKWKGEVGVVSDGEKIYMSATEAGDEAFLLAKNLPKVPVLIGADRAVTGRYAVEQLHADVVILDDGYQHWRLVRDLDILLIDAINIFGNNYMLPRGTLREPLDHLDRADVCLLTKVDQANSDACSIIKNTVKKYNEKALIVTSVHSPKYFVEVADWYKGASNHTTPIDSLKGKKVTAVSAIGNPASFEQTISDVGAEVIDSVRFADHHDYTMAEMQIIMDNAIECGSDALIITEKDLVKIPAEFIHSSRDLPVYVLSMEIAFIDGYDPFIQLIATSLKNKKLINKET